MSPLTISLLGIGLMLLVMLLRMPVSFAMIAVGFGGVWYMTTPEAAYQLLSADLYRQFASYSLSVIPLFILMGQITFRAGISDRLFSTAYRWIGSRPGGIAATTVLASIGFSAVSGSNAASTATMGAVAYPEMKKYGYDPGFSGAAIAIGGTLGVMTPPSTALIIIAIQSEQSIARLFFAAIIPGFLVGLLLLATVLVVCWRRPELGPPGPRFTWKERFASLGGVVEALVLFAAVLGGMYLGWFTPTEAGAAGAFGALLVAAARGNLTPRALWTSVIHTLRVSAMVVLLVTSAIIFGRFLTLTRMPFELAAWATDLPVEPVVVLLVVLLIYLVAGALMDALGFLVVSIPIFFPLAAALGYDPVWFTIVITLVTTLGAVTPPVGVNVFIVSGLDRSLDVVQVFRAVMVFLVPYALALVLFLVFPGLIVR